MAGVDRRQSQQLVRLQRLTDVVYALVIWRLFQFMPKPEEEYRWQDFGNFVVQNGMVFVLIIIGFVFTMIYWVQSNAAFTKLAGTDNRHTVLSILQVFSLLIFLYSLHVGIVLGGSPGTRAFEALAAALVGFVGSAAWSYASRNRRLLHDDVTDAEARQFSNRILAEPIAACITLPFVFTPIFWELAWFSYAPVHGLLHKKRKQP